MFHKRVQFVKYDVSNKKEEDISNMRLDDSV